MLDFRSPLRSVSVARWVLGLTSQTLAVTFCPGLIWAGRRWRLVSLTCTIGTRALHTTRRKSSVCSAYIRAGIVIEQQRSWHSSCAQLHPSRCCLLTYGSLLGDSAGSCRLANNMPGHVTHPCTSPSGPTLHLTGPPESSDALNLTHSPRAWSQLDQQTVVLYFDDLPSHRGPQLQVACCHSLLVHHTRLQAKDSQPIKGAATNDPGPHCLPHVEGLQGCLCSCPTLIREMRGACGGCGISE